ncbi:hypothetical protein ACMFMG_007911 [Clarireedia jacksonii]
MANGYSGVETSSPMYGPNYLDNRSPNMQARHQRAMKLNLHPTRPLTSPKVAEFDIHGNGNTSGRRSPFPYPPRSPRSPTPSSRPSTPSSRENLSPSQNRKNYPAQRPSTSHHPTPNEPYRSFTAPPPQQNVRRKLSDTSRLRQLNNVRSHSSTGRRTPEIAVDNFSRPRGASLRRRNESPSPLIHGLTYPTEPQIQESPANYGMGYSTRDRGLSTSSSQSGQQHHHSHPLRPSASIPDYHTSDMNHTKQRNLNNSTFRPRTALSGRPDSNNSSIYRRDPPIRPTGFDDEEVRASFRSALTTNSSYFGTSGTERSSVLTKSSSRTSFLGKDEGMTVDDAIGMYEGGFMDSGMEDNDLDEKLLEAGGEIKPRRVFNNEDYDEKVRPVTPDSDIRNSKEEEAMGEPLAPPDFMDGSRYAIRESTDMFHAKTLDIPSPAATPCLTPGDFPDGKEFEAQVSRDDYFEPQPTDRPAPTPPLPDASRDRYGFRKKTQYVSLEEYEAWYGPYSEYVERRRRKWVALMRDNNLITDKPMRFPPKTAKVKRFVRKGIPPDWRGEAWFWYAGGPAMVAKHYGVYDALVKQAAAGGVSQTDDEIIERDLNRTFPDNIKFKPDPPPASYCQSLNFLAGLLLLFMDEEKSFWMLNIITRVYLPGTHEVNLEGANVDLGVLMTSIKESMPAIWAKIGGELDGTAGDGRISMRLPPITLCTTAWFMSCFIGTLPIETTLRVWDSFFFEGSKTLFRIALAIFKVGEQEIKAVSDPMEIFQVVQTIPRRLIDASSLMDACFRRRNGFGHLSQETIEQRRAERRKGYADERAIANGETPVNRKGTFFSSKKKTRLSEE